MTLHIHILRRNMFCFSGEIELPVSFLASEPGQYPCQLTLHAGDDIRVYNIECTASPQGNEAALEFSTPTHQPVTQNIPIVRVHIHTNL